MAYWGGYFGGSSGSSVAPITPSVSVSSFGFDPTVAEFMDEAFERAGVDPKIIGIDHIRSSRRSMNLMFSDWATRGRKLWALDQVTVDCVADQATYSLDVGTMGIAGMVVRRSSTDTPVNPMDRDSYLRIPNKTQTGLPCMYWFDRDRAAQRLVIWPAAENSTDDLIFYRIRRLEDVNTARQTVDLAYHWFEAFASGLAWRLALKFNPTKVPVLKAFADESFKAAYDNERESVDTQVCIG